MCLPSISSLLLPCRSLLEGGCSSDALWTPCPQSKHCKHFSLLASRFLWFSSCSAILQELGQHWLDRLSLYLWDGKSSFCIRIPWLQERNEPPPPAYSGNSVVTTSLTEVLGLASKIKLRARVIFRSNIKMSLTAVLVNKLFPKSREKKRFLSWAFEH